MHYRHTGSEPPLSREQAPLDPNDKVSPDATRSERQESPDAPSAARSLASTRRALPVPCPANNLAASPPAGYFDLPEPDASRLTDRELLAALRDGSEAAFETVFRAHYPGLVRFAESILSDRAQGEEVAQDVLLELWRRRSSLVVETSLQAYLFRAARNRSLNSIRHDRVVQREEAGIAAAMVPVETADRAVLNSEIDTAVRAAVQTLPPRCREVFELSRYRNLTYAEIAVALDISVKTVEAQMGKALRVLREQLAPWVERRDGDE